MPRSDARRGDRRRRRSTPTSAPTARRTRPPTPSPPTSPTPSPPTSPTPAPTLPSAAKFWLTDPAGDVWSFGGAKFQGSLGGQALRQPIVATAATSTGGGYWMVASDGGVFS